MMIFKDVASLRLFELSPVRRVWDEPERRLPARPGRPTTVITAEKFPLFWSFWMCIYLAISSGFASVFGKYFGLFPHCLSAAAQRGSRSHRR